MTNEIVIFYIRYNIPKIKNIRPMTLTHKMMKDTSKLATPGDCISIIENDLNRFVHDSLGINLKTSDHQNPGKTL